MIVYQASKAQFLVDAKGDTRAIEDVILEAVNSKLGLNIQVNSPEYISWRNSIGSEMYKCIDTDEIPSDADVAIEYRIPRTKNRIDFLISGLDENQKENVVMVELKQWSEVGLTGKDAIVTTRFKGGIAETTHPSYQAWSYASLMQNFNETVYSDGILLHPCAYAHNMSDRSVIHNAFYQDHIDKSPVFCKDERNGLKEFIKKFVKYGDSKHTLYRIDTGFIRPSKELADSLVGMMKGKKEFVLIDDQKIAYENALYLVKKAGKDEKHVLIIEGGPGTGKSVVAINLLATLINSGFNARYITRNAAPRAVFKAVLSGSIKESNISNLFEGPDAYANADANTMDALIVDEAHRLSEKGGFYGNLGENQIKELINSSKIAVFFVDDDQKVTWKDIGSVGEIEKWANKLGATVHKTKLESQFRCNGSDGFIEWVDNTFGIKETANNTLDGVVYDFQVFDTPNEMREAIIAKNSRNKARILAGYCWQWISKKNKYLYDIQFPEHSFEMQWNLTDYGNTYMIAPNSINQVGCIHTCQGLELEYVGVIIGPDLIARNGVVQTDTSKRARSDKSLNGYKRDLKAGVVGTEKKADTIIRNTYRTLMTRGMKGCYIYCTDKETGEYFKQKMTLGSKPSPNSRTE